VIGYERLIGFAYEAKRVQALIETARQEGHVEELASHGPYRLVRGASAAEVRGWLCRAPQASDEQVRVVVEGLAPTRPAMLAVDRPHIYDAAAVALFAMHEHLGRRLVLSSALERALFDQQQKDQSSRAAKREAKANGTFVPEKRSLTRAQSQRRSAASKQAWAIRKGGA
jgi:hypothetical protein